MADKAAQKQHRERMNTLVKRHGELLSAFVQGKIVHKLYTSGAEPSLKEGDEGFITAWNLQNQAALMIGKLVNQDDGKRRKKLNEFKEIQTDELGTYEVAMAVFVNDNLAEMSHASAMPASSTAETPYISNFRRTASDGPPILPSALEETMASMIGHALDSIERATCVYPTLVKERLAATTDRLGIKVSDWGSLDHKRIKLEPASDEDDYTAIPFTPTPGQVRIKGKRKVRKLDLSDEGDD